MLIFRGLTMMTVIAGISMCSSPAIYCEVTEPISWSVNDTDQTKAEVKEHNAVFDSLCKRSIFSR